MHFDEIIKRRGTHSMKWDMMEALYGVSANDGIAMWVADMDFRPPDSARMAVERMLDYGVFGYYGDQAAYLEAIRWWMRNRHGWEVQPEWVFTTHGLVNGTALCVDAFTAPGDGVVLFTPAYHAFKRVIDAAGRRVVECPLDNREGRYEMAFSDYGDLLSGGERLAILCSPHNPGGRVWNRAELRELARFCEERDLLLVSDEIHHDLVLPGHQHVPMALAAPEILNRLVMMTAITKSFNLAGAHTGNVIIPDSRLRGIFGTRMAALGISPNSFGLFMAEAVYSPDGAAWLARLMDYIDRNRLIFDQAMNGIPGVRSMPLEATYLAWVDFSGTGLTDQEVVRRIQKDAKVAVNIGHTFGTGGDGFMRFNIATPRSILEQALDRLTKAFLECG